MEAMCASHLFFGRVSLIILQFESVVFAYHLFSLPLSRDLARRHLEFARGFELYGGFRQVGKKKRYPAKKKLDLQALKGIPHSQDAGKTSRGCQCQGKAQGSWRGEIGVPNIDSSDGT